MKKPVKICFFSGTRAEYGLLRPLMQKIKREKIFRLQLIASGTHLSKEFGQTYREIINDGMKINKRVGMLLESDRPHGICQSIGQGISGMSKAISSLRPDAIVILGDRFEALSAAISAYVHRVPIIHLYGGEATYGLVDEAIRHSITKMSSIHFTSASVYRKRVIQLGENPKRVFNVGALGADNIKKLKLLSKKEFEKKTGFRFNRFNLLVTFHPVTLENNTAACQFKRLLKVLDERRDTSIIFTKANADTFGRVINKMIDSYVKKNARKAMVFTSMGQILYLSAMRHVDGVVGNSSSGIIEAPYFRIGTVNIGDRQAGRIRLKSIIDCNPEEQSIRKAIMLLYSDKFRQGLKNLKIPYGMGNTASKIMKILKSYDFNTTLKKRFFDIDFDI